MVVQERGMTMYPLKGSIYILLNLTEILHLLPRPPSLRSGSVFLCVIGCLSLCVVFVCSLRLCLSLCLCLCLCLCFKEDAIFGSSTAGAKNSKKAIELLNNTALSQYQVHFINILFALLSYRSHACAFVRFRYILSTFYFPSSLTETMILFFFSIQFF